MKINKLVSIGLVATLLTVSFWGCSGNGASTAKTSKQSSENTLSNYYIDNPNYMSNSSSKYAYYLKNDMKNSEYVTYLSSLKNKEIEVPYSEKGYSEKELEQLYRQTTVIFDFRYKVKGKGYYGKFMGNIYDIDDKYMYLISCAHGVGDLNEPGKFRDQLEVDATFANNETVGIKNENIFIMANEDNSCTIDIAIIKIPLGDISGSILSSAKSVNIDKCLYMDITNLNDYTFYHMTYRVDSKNDFAKFCNDGSPYLISNMLALANEEQTIVPGTSGGAHFDQHGTYHGFLTNVNETKGHSIVKTVFVLYIGTILSKAGYHF